MANISDYPESLNGKYTSFADGAKVIFLPTRETASVLYSFFLQNSETGYVICSLIRFENAGSSVIFCPNSMLVNKPTK